MARRSVLQKPCAHPDCDEVIIKRPDISYERFDATPYCSKQCRLSKPGASYQAAHNHVRRIRGWASEHSCVHCGGPAVDWAYRHDSRCPRERTDLKGRRYSFDAARYQAMCRLCHNRFDREHITHCPRGHEYIGQNLKLTRSGLRKCRTCENTYVREYGRRRRAIPRVRRGDKLTPVEVVQIRELYAVGGITQDELAMRFMTTAFNIWQIVNGKTWRNVA